MSSEQLSSEFFDVLQRHSEAKLQILSRYVIPWMRKIVLNPWNQENKCVVIDGFAGKGKYAMKADEVELGASSEVNGSPMILLQTAIEFCEQAAQRGWNPPKIELMFVEGDTDNYEILKSNLNELCGIEFTTEGRAAKVPAHPTVRVRCVNKDFKDALGEVLAHVKGNMIPSFTFIDPFGFSQTPMELITELMKIQSAEFLINFIYEETNRFIRYEQEMIERHISNHFGVESLQEIRNLIGENKGEKRKEIVVDYYTRQLKEQANVAHVLNFVIKKKGRTKMILFFGTNNYEGLKLMKKVIWDIDGTGSYKYDDRQKLEDIQFKYLSEIDYEIAVQELAQQIYHHFMGHEKITQSMVEEFVILETIYPKENFMDRALKFLEETDKIVDVQKIDLSKRRKGSFKDVYIRFE